MPPAPRKKRPAPKAPAAPIARKRRKRSPWPWRAILGTLLFGNIVVGIFRSPALPVRRAVIEGASEGEAPLAAAAVAGLRGQPALQADARTIEGSALADARYEAADFRRSLFGTARLTLRRRVAVACVPDDPPLLLDASGTVYDDPSVDWRPLPRLLLTDDLRMTSVALGAPCDLRRLAEIAARVRPISGGRPVGIDVQAGGVICLNMESARVRLGTGDRLEAKLSTLRRILAQRPGILREVKELNLMAPDRPKMVPRNAPKSTSVSPESAPESSRRPDRSER